VLLNPETLIALREAKGLSKSELAVEAEMSLSYLSEIEAGKKSPSISVIAKLATALGVNIHALGTITKATAAS
jgi:transcriptional regulator with XRE-family HTH domain